MARIETEKLLLQLLEAELESRRGEGKFGGKFAGLTHYFGWANAHFSPSFWLRLNDGTVFILSTLCDTSKTTNPRTIAHV